MKTAKLLGILASLLLLASSLLHLAFIAANEPAVPLWLWTRRWSVIGWIYLVCSICGAMVLYFAFKILAAFSMESVFVKFKQILALLAILVALFYLYFKLNFGGNITLFAILAISFYICKLWFEINFSQSTTFKVYAFMSAAIFGLFSAIFVATLFGKYFLLYLIFLGELNCVLALVFLNLMMLFSWLSLKNS